MRDAAFCLCLSSIFVVLLLLIPPSESPLTHAETRVSRAGLVRLPDQFGYVVVAVAPSVVVPIVLV
jgi:hypothetical protein